MSINWKQKAVIWATALLVVMSIGLKSSYQRSSGVGLWQLKIWGNFLSAKVQNLENPKLVKFVGILKGKVFVHVYNLASTKWEAIVAILVLGCALFITATHKTNTGRTKNVRSLGQVLDLAKDKIANSPPPTVPDREGERTAKTDKPYQ